MDTYDEFYRLRNCNYFANTRDPPPSQYYHDKETLRLVLETNNEHIIKTYCDGLNMINEHTLSIAINCCNMNIIKYLIDKGAPINKGLFMLAVASKKIDIIELLVAKGYKDDGTGCDVALKIHNMEMLIYLHEHEHPWNSTLFDTIQEGYHDIKFLKYMHENNYFKEVKIEYVDYDFLFADRETIEYCHDNKLPEDWRCEESCKECIRQRAV